MLPDTFIILNLFLGQCYPLRSFPDFLLAHEVWASADGADGDEAEDGPEESAPAEHAWDAL